MLNRTRLVVLCAIGLLIAAWRLDRPVRSEGDSGMSRYRRAPGVIRELLDRAGANFTATEQRTLRDATQQLSMGVTAKPIDLPQAQGLCVPCEGAMSRIVPVLGGSSVTERLWVEAGRMIRQTVHRQWPSGNGALVVRLGLPGQEGDTVPDFVSKEFDLATSASGEIQMSPAGTVFAVLFFENAAPGTRDFPVKIVADGKTVAEVRLTIQVPPAGELKVEIADAKTGAPTAAVVGLYAADNRLVVPPQAISFDEAGFSYRKGQARPYNVRYWPGNPFQRQAFFVDGGFSLAVPAGEYTLIVGKGFEYTPVTLKVQVKASATVERKVALNRWVNMAARGWVSGDAHVHYARSGEASNRRLMTWARAEDVHVANVMRMGDAQKTYFEQYAYGKPGRFASGEYTLVPGQEDPRTSYIGHTLHMNIQAPFRAPDRYYFYDLVFDEMRRQGAITTYVHTYQDTMHSFFVRLDMSLNIIKGRADGLEICEFGDVDDHLYNEFLNLGFKLTATAGSDVPWGNSVGQSRMYAYTGKRSDPDAWYEAVKAGHTFVTAGPMIELWVNGKPPGSEIEAQPGETLEVRATATGREVLPQYLDVIAQGEVLRSIKAPPVKPGTLVAQFKLPVRESTWIAARCAYAHTTPVYIKVDGKPFWKVRAVPELVERRLTQLRQMEEFAKVGPGPGGEGGYNIPEAGFAVQVPQLLERIEEARRLYADLLRRVR